MAAFLRFERIRGQFLCPDSHIIPQLPSTREGKVVDSKSFMNENQEAVTSTKETLVWRLFLRFGVKGVVNLLILYQKAKL